MDKDQPKKKLFLFASIVILSASMITWGLISLFKPSGYEEEWGAGEGEEMEEDFEVEGTTPSENIEIEEEIEEETPPQLNSEASPKKEEQKQTETLPATSESQTQGTPK